MIPDFQTAMRPALAALADGETQRPRDVMEIVAQEFDVTSEEREQLIPSGKQSLIYNRVTWALTYLFQAGLTERPRRGYVRIRDLGRKALADHCVRIDMKVLEQYPAYLEFKERTREREPSGDSAMPAPESISTPQDLLGRVSQ